MVEARPQGLPKIEPNFLMREFIRWRVTTTKIILGDNYYYLQRHVKNIVVSKNEELFLEAFIPFMKTTYLPLPLKIN